MNERRTPRAVASPPGAERDPSAPDIRMEAMQGPGRMREGGSASLARCFFRFEEAHVLTCRSLTGGGKFNKGTSTPPQCPDDGGRPCGRPWGVWTSPEMMVCNRAPPKVPNFRNYCGIPRRMTPHRLQCANVELEVRIRNSYCIILPTAKT